MPWPSTQLQRRTIHPSPSSTSLELGFWMVAKWTKRSSCLHAGTSTLHSWRWHWCGAGIVLQVFLVWAGEPSYAQVSLSPPWDLNYCCLVTCFSVRLFASSVSGTKDASYSGPSPFSKIRCKRFGGSGRTFFCRPDTGTAPRPYSGQTLRTRLRQLLAALWLPTSRTLSPNLWTLAPWEPVGRRGGYKRLKMRSGHVVGDGGSMQKPWNLHPGNTGDLFLRDSAFGDPQTDRELELVFPDVWKNAFPRKLQRYHVLPGLFCFNNLDKKDLRGGMGMVGGLH